MRGTIDGRALLKRQESYPINGPRSLEHLFPAPSSEAIDRVGLGSLPLNREPSQFKK